MQTTLLGIAIALILALVTALVGPAFVNWNNHRGFVQREASLLIGLPVYVTGAIDVTILPTPSVTLRAIEIGHPSDENRMRAGALAFTLGLGPLMRGVIRAVEVRLVGPEMTLKVNKSGALDLPNVAMKFNRETVSIERLSVEEGRAILVDTTSGARMVLDKLSFKGDLRSLVGPIRGEGNFAVAGAEYSYRISTSRFGADGIKLKLGVDASALPLTIEADGTLAFERSAPRFEGSLVVTRPVGAALASGKAMVNEPWQATSRIKATSAGVNFDQVEFQYGPEDRAMKFAGTAEVKLGDQPRLQGVFSARQLDLDRMIATPDRMRRLPFAAVKTFAEMFGSMLHPALPTRLALSVDTVTLGGASLQAVTSDLSSDGGVWNLDKLDFRAPGFTQVRANGRLELTAKGLGFAGLANVNATDSLTLLAWLTGRGNPAPGPLKSWHAHGNITLTSDRIAIEQLKTAFDGATLEGRLAYAASSDSHPAILDADLRAAGIDADAWLQVAETMAGGLALEMPREAALKLEIDKVRIAGLETRKAAVQLKLDANSLDLQRLSMDGFGSNSFEASGRIESLASSPRGNIKVDLDARDLSALIALAEKYVPTIVEPIRRLSGRQPTAKLTVNLGVESASPSALTKRSTAKFGVEGQIGAFRINVAGGAAADPRAFSLTDLSGLAGAELKLEGQLDTEDGSALLALLGLERMAAAEKRAGRLKFAASGPLNRDLRVDGRLTAGLIDMTGRGNANFSPDQPTVVKFNQVLGMIGGIKVEGRLTVSAGSPMRIDGTIATDKLDVQAAMAPLIGKSLQQLKSTDEGGREIWSLEPFAPTALGFAGRVELKVARAALSEKLHVKSLQGILQFGASRVTLEILDGDLGRGRLTGQLAILNSPEGLSTLNYIELIGADAAALIPGEGRPPITGVLTLQATIEGAGLSPAAFMGSLHGTGTITIEDAEFAGLNPRVFDALTRAVDLGIQADAKQIREFVAILIDKGQLGVKKAQSSIEFVGGQARLVSPQVEANGADLTVAGAINLSDASVDATLGLAGATTAGVAGRPAVSVTLKGPIAAPRYAFNADSLAGWLALRSVEQQSKRLETIEATRRAAAAQSPAVLSATPPARAIDDDEANSQQTQAITESGPISPDTTGGVFGVMQAPPLPPPVMVQPSISGAERQRAPASAGRSQ